MTNRELLEQVMLKDPLYKGRVADSLIYVEDLVSLRPINFPCLVCQSEQTFALAEIDNELPSKAGHSWAQHERLSAASLIGSGISSSGRLRPSPLEGGSRHVTFRCAKCSSYSIDFYLAFSTVQSAAKDKEKEAKTNVQKVGQLPPLESTVDSNIEKWLSKADLDLYKKGLRSEAHGFGIGAFSYFRRIVENNAQKILEGVNTTTDNEELKTAIAAALKKHTATDRLELVKDHAPTSFAVDGQNVFTILYGALSAGIHGKSDQECLSLATNIRVCLSFLIQTIAITQQEQDKLKEALKNISGS